MGYNYRFLMPKILTIISKDNVNIAKVNFELLIMSMAKLLI